MVFDLNEYGIRLKSQNMHGSALVSRLMVTSQGFYVIIAPLHRGDSPSVAGTRIPRYIHILSLDDVCKPVASGKSGYHALLQDSSLARYNPTRKTLLYERLARVVFVSVGVVLPGSTMSSRPPAAPSRRPHSTRPDRADNVFKGPQTLAPNVEELRHYILTTGLPSTSNGIVIYPTPLCATGV